MRRCHGDLHLANICLWEGRPTLFDAIEFSDAIATIDVLYDLAFLLMDLEHRDLSALGNLVFNRYFDWSSEEDGLAALPLFLSVRAGIRAHVTATAMRGRSDAAADLASTPRRYLALAQSLLMPASPRLIVVAGLSGTGKSTVASGMAPHLAPAPGARVLRSDVLRKRMLGHAPEERLPEGAYDRATTERVYAELCRRARETLAAGYTAIVDAVFLMPEERRAIAAVAAAAGVPFTGLWLEAPRERLAERIAGREGDASDADVVILDRQLALDPGPLDWRRIPVSGTPAESLAQALAAVEFLA